MIVKLALYTSQIELLTLSRLDRTWVQLLEDKFESTERASSWVGTLQGPGGRD